MGKIIKDNLYFFLPFFTFLLVSGGLLLFIDQGDAILFFSDNRSVIADTIFVYGTRMGEVPIYLIAIIFGLFIRFRYSILVFLTGVIVTIVSFITKSIFAHDRPSVFFRKLRSLEEVNLVDGIDLHTGATSFPSGHTMSAFALFGIIAFLLPYKKTVGVLCFIGALVVGISRIYLVQHFLKDVFLGSMIGVLLAMLLYYFQDRLPYSTHYWFNRSASIAGRRIGR
jgi:membrane-associated phospholipid phosphatase